MNIQLAGIDLGMFWMYVHHVTLLIITVDCTYISHELIYIQTLISILCEILNTSQHFKELYPYIYGFW